MMKVTWKNIAPPYPTYKCFRTPTPVNDPRAVIDGLIVCYAKPKDAIPIYECAGFKARYIDEENTQAYLLEKDGIQLICFRGTESRLKYSKPSEIFKDLSTDLSFPANTHGIHTGFAKAYDVIAKHIKIDKPTILAGHSLGGALAQICAMKNKASANLITLYTFGAPKAGTEKFASTLNELYPAAIRYTHGNDGIPLLPPEEFGFAHVGKHIHFGHGASEKPKDFNGWWLFSLLLPVPGWIRDHSPILYAEHLWEDTK